MGTNFFWRYNFRGSLNFAHIFDWAHLGKSSAGWSFTFRAYPADETPFGFPVMSRRDWTYVFSEHPGQLYDEYDRLIDNPGGWLTRIKPPTVAQIIWEEEQQRTHAPITSDRALLIHRDLEGFQFCAFEFF